MKILKNHVILCCFADSQSPLIGLCNCVMPLRASCLRRQDLRTIVLIGDEKFIRREWDALANFPAVYVKPVSGEIKPLCRFAAEL